MTSFTHALLFLFVLFAAGLVVSCSPARKNESQGISGIVAQVVGESPLTDETLARLRAIAEAPSSHLPPAPEDSSDSPESSNTTVSGPDSSATLLGGETLAPPRNRGTVAIGDIFSDHAGSDLDKAFSFADFLPAASWEKTLSEIAVASRSRVPLTLTTGDMQNLRAVFGNELALPSRSIALDLRTISHRADIARLERAYESLSGTNENPNFLEAAHRDALSNALSSVRDRLKAGERLFAITGVTQSIEALASYPGAPLGQRDADLIRNAITATYPHLDGLEGTRDGDVVRITREPDMYWEFETRELLLKDERLVLAAPSPAGI